MRPGMFDSYGGCLRRLWPALLLGAVLWALIIFGTWKLVERTLR